MAHANTAVRGGKQKSYPQLRAQSQPQNASQPEFYRDILFDIQTFTDNTSTNLIFFGQAQNDPTLSNMPNGGSLPAGVFFTLKEICLDVFPAAGYVTTAAGGVTGMVNDIGLMMVTNRPTIELVMNDKKYGQWPAIACRALGGVQGQIAASFTAPIEVQHASLGRLGDGLFMEELITLNELTPFTLALRWPNVVDITADYKVRCSLRGTRYRRVA